MIDYEGGLADPVRHAVRVLIEGRVRPYELRPEICRDYDPVDCERYAGPAVKGAPPLTGGSGALPRARGAPEAREKKAREEG